MAQKFPFPFDEFVFVSVQGGTEQPTFFRLSLKRIHSVLLTALSMTIVLFLLSLLFFRELEINRKLNHRLLELETNNLLQSQRSYVLLPPAPQGNSTAASGKPVTSAASPTTPVNTIATDTPPPVANTSSGISARISDLFAECTDESCDVKLNLAPSQQGTASGQLLMVLELEVPRIGASTSQIRKKYIVYPGFLSLDEVTPAKLQAFEKKPFKFSRGLTTGTTFTMGKLLEPLAINVYLFDDNGNVVVHERRPIEREESDAP